MTREEKEIKRKKKDIEKRRRRKRGKEGKLSRNGETGMLLACCSMPMFLS